MLQTEASLLVELMQLVYNGRFRAGVGCIEALNSPDTGLTDWGRAIIDEMVRQGIVLDLSHASPKTTEDAMNHMNQHHSGVPVVYTHSPPAGLYKNEPNATPEGCYRNISDECVRRQGKSVDGFPPPNCTLWSRSWNSVHPVTRKLHAVVA